MNAKGEWKEAKANIISFGRIELRVLGNIPKIIRGLVIDVDGTVYPADAHFFKKRQEAQEKWLCNRLGVPPKELHKKIEQTKQVLTLGNRKRVSLSQAVYALDPSITCEEWKQAMIKAADPANLNGRIRPNPDLEEVITNLTADRIEGLRIIFGTNAPAEVAGIILKMVFGARIFSRGMFGIVGHDRKISKPDPRFFRELVLPQMGSKGVRFDQVISIGDRLHDDGIAAIEAGMAAAIIVDGPNGLICALKHIGELKKLEPR